VGTIESTSLHLIKAGDNDMKLTDLIDLFSKFSPFLTLFKIVNFIFRSPYPKILGQWEGTGSNSKYSLIGLLSGNPTSFNEKFKFIFQIDRWCWGEFVFTNPDTKKEVAYSFLAKFTSLDIISANFKPKNGENLDQGAFLIKLKTEMNEGQGAAFSINFENGLPRPCDYRIKRISG
jgi:hypothetical protein